MAGDPERAEQLATAAFEMGTDSGQPDAFAIYGSQLMYIRHQQGRLGELVSLIDQAVVENPGLPAFRPILASAHLEAGNDATALGLLDSAAADEFASLPPDFLWMMGVTFYALVTVELTAAGPARKLYDLLEPLSRANSLHRNPWVLSGLFGARRPGLDPRPLRRGRGSFH